MEDAQGQVTNDAAIVYEKFFVPALFAEWAPRLLDAAHVDDSCRILDVASGTGVVAREAARRVGAERVVGLDRNPGMLDVARSIEPRISWRDGRAEALPFEDACFDRVVSQFGLMFFESKSRALAEMWRVLRPGGVLAVAVWARLEDTPGYRAMSDLLARLFSDAIAAELRAPFALGEVKVLRQLFDEARIPTVSVESKVGRARFPSIADWVQTDIRGWTLSDQLDDADLARLIEHAERELEHFARQGFVEFASPAHLVTAQKPN